MTTPTASPPREKSVLDGVTLTSGAEQVIDFLLPLFAGAVLGLTAWETGLLVAASQLAAFGARPLAGVVTDRAPRTIVAGAGATGFGIACLLYAAAGGLGLALTAALLSGAAGAFWWVAARAVIGERLGEDSSVFAKLLAAEELGGWIILVPAIILLGFAGYTWVFVSIAACCFLAAVTVLTADRTSASATDQSGTADERSLVRVGTRLRPMLLAVAMMMTAEAAISLLLILHLQRGFSLDVIEVAYVFLPGAILMSVLPPHLHRFVVRFGRRKALIVGSVASALFAAGLAFAPNPVTIAVLWVLAAVAWSLVTPVEQAVIAEAVGASHLGKGLSLYEAACLVGAFAGSLTAGFLYDTGSWPIACLACATIILAGTLLVPTAVRRLGVADTPVEQTNVTFSPPPHASGPENPHL
ncbi:MAG: MFS transporter [Propioniciclava sp.]